MRRSLNAFTLIEALAVVVLLGIATALMVPLLTRGTDATTADTAISRFRVLDARARQIAQSGRGARLQRTSDGEWRLFGSMWESGDHSADKSPVTQWRPPYACRVRTLDDAGSEIEYLVYGATGRSSDFVLAVETESARRVAHIAGLTGWFKVESTR